MGSLQFRRPVAISRGARTGATIDVRNARGAVICSTTVAQDGTGYNTSVMRLAAGHER
ncbi:MAG: hypothetical protein KF892_07295 [Rhizobacter sp.]|nr:hypothetical protein [Rhizobacter sp.]